MAEELQSKMKVESSRELDEEQFDGDNDDQLVPDHEAVEPSVENVEPPKLPKVLRKADLLL